ncbi:MAG TPA: glycoside hydrolase family 2 TIM barrel-domain containing protein, partial [Marinilabiliaceae bacterium]|nr:glycoside hydrolase family 2 TIM barrel-domain containing protein [Marinilabiliaceae bacterium]
MRSFVAFSYLLMVFALGACGKVTEDEVRVVYPFNDHWKFSLGDDSLAFFVNFDDSQWRDLDLPHDWSIEGKFDESHATGQFGGALPAGVGWYRKTFTSPRKMEGKLVRVEFDGVYRNSEVWINEHYLGIRPFGYISFQYDITPYLHGGDSLNVIAVRVDNEKQPNSRWYTGSGIYRDVRLTATEKIRVAHWGTFVTTPNISEKSADVELEVTIDRYVERASIVKVSSSILDCNGKVITTSNEEILLSDPQTVVKQSFVVDNPQLWSPQTPYLYSVVTKIYKDNQLIDNYTTPLGIRYFHFDAEKGFFLNGQSFKIQGVCLHHDLGALGAAYNRRANQRQLEIMKSMGVNAIRTAHNPFDPKFYQLCDEMGFLVMDESFDVWVKRKAKQDYHVDFEEWHKRDLQDMVLRDRNHPSVFMYSIGNEIREQFDSTGLSITRQLVDIVKELDTTRPVTSGLTENQPHLNYITQSDALDVLGFNYKHEVYDSLMHLFPGKSIIASENVSGYATRGVYIMPSDSIQAWPTAHDKPLVGANDDFTVSSYDNIHAYWGSTHADNWRMIKKHDYVSGVFIWTGIDYIGEPSPYPYPARSSYFGLVDLAGFPKDSYYMYQS